MCVQTLDYPAEEVERLRESWPVGELEAMLVKNIMNNIKHNDTKVRVMLDKLRRMNHLQAGLMEKIKSIEDPEVKKILYLEAEREMLTIIRCKEIVEREAEGANKVRECKIESNII